MISYPKNKRDGRDLTLNVMLSQAMVWVNYGGGCDSQLERDRG